MVNRLPSGYNPGHTPGCENRNSPFETIFSRQQIVWPNRLGMSRSELYATAVKEFVSRHRRRRITERLNKVYGAEDTASALDEALHAFQIRSLPTEDWR